MVITILCAVFLAAGLLKEQIQMFYAQYYRDSDTKDTEDTIDTIKK